MKPHKCPVCDGKGKLSNNTCHACNGKGYILCPEDVQSVPKFDVINGGQRQG